MRLIGHLLLPLLLACAAAGEAQQIRVSTQLVAMPHPDLTELLSSPDQRGHFIHQLAMARVAKNQAEILEQSMVVCKSGQKAIVESIREFIYPTEYDLEGLNGNRPVTLPGASLTTTSSTTIFRPMAPPAWDTRNTGVSLEVEPTLSADGKLVDIRFLPELVTLVRLNTITAFSDRWGDASVRMPVFETLRQNTALTVAPGRFELAAILTPKPTAPGPAPGKKVMLFLRADLITLPTNR